MKKTLTTYQIAHELHPDFSFPAALALAKWLEEYEQSTGEELEMDAVAIRCDWSEYETLAAWADDYFTAGIVDACEVFGLDPDDLDPEDPSEDAALLDAIRDYIRDRGDFIEFDGGVVVSAF